MCMIRSIEYLEMFTLKLRESYWAKKVRQIWMSANQLAPFLSGFVFVSRCRLVVVVVFVSRIPNSWIVIRTGKDRLWWSGAPRRTGRITTRSRNWPESCDRNQRSHLYCSTSSHDLAFKSSKSSLKKWKSVNLWLFCVMKYSNEVEVILLVRKLYVIFKLLATSSSSEYY